MQVLSQTSDVIIQDFKRTLPGYSFLKISRKFGQHMALQHDYSALLAAAPCANKDALIRYLDAQLQNLWADDYRKATPHPSEVLIINFHDDLHPTHTYSCLFDHASCAGLADKQHDDRTVAFWGLSSPRPADTRDKPYIAGLLRGVWSDRYDGDDRGHFIAHTSGGRLDVNLFPQEKTLNRGGEWRQMERYCSTHPKTFFFVRPLYHDDTWRPAFLEFGIYTTAEDAVRFWGQSFRNAKETED